MKRDFAGCYVSGVSVGVDSGVEASMDFGMEAGGGVERGAASTRNSSRGVSMDRFTLSPPGEKENRPVRESRSNALRALAPSILPETQ